MKRTTKIAIAIAAVFALCLGLVGCGGGDGADYTRTSRAIGNFLV